MTQSSGDWRGSDATSIPVSPQQSSPPPDYRRTWIKSPTPVKEQPVVHAPTRLSPHEAHVEISPKRHLTDKGKGSEILHIDTSPSSSYVATKHGNKTVKIWSTAKNALHGTIKFTSYVQPRVRSREYFVRGHAILSENASLIGITTHFGLTLEIYNFAKGGSGAKKVQVIEEAHRWAASHLDAFHNDYAGLAVYRPKFDRIDRFFLSRILGTKTPFREDPNHSIELQKAGLPFLPKFPELANSSDSSILVAAAGPRPGEPPRANATILVAWQMQPVTDGKLHAQTPEQSNASLPDEDLHKPYRVCVPDYPALQTALPACLAAHGTTAVSIWIPAANPSDAAKTRLPPAAPTTPVSAPDRLVLTWDLPNNTTSLFSIPPFAQACISPDCRRVAYCNTANGASEFVIVDVATRREVWRWPEAASEQGFASFGQLENMKGVRVFEFSRDGGVLVVGDGVGGVG
ncbi:hypothetical protein C8A05DRAFT_20333, partial [Staphylotrichum tortipilum]